MRGLVVERVVDKSGRSTDRYSIDLRYRDATGKPQRYRERMADGIKAAAAKARALSINGSAAAGTLVADTEDPRTLGDALAEYEKWSTTNRPNSLQSKKTQIKALRAGLVATTLLDELSAFGVERFKRQRLEALRKAKGIKADEHTGHATVNRALATLKHAVGQFRAWGWMTGTKADEIRAVKLFREPPGRVRHLTADEEAGLFKALPKGIGRIVVAAGLCGARRAELVMLKKAAVDLQTNEITLTKTKAGKVRRLPINETLHALLEAAMNGTTSDYVFTHKRRGFDLRYTEAAVSRAFHRACVKAELVDLRLHDMRHHFATMVRREGHGIDVIQQLLGHATLAMTMRYAHVGRAELHNAVANLGTPRIAQDKGVSNEGPKEKREPLRIVAGRTDRGC